MGSSPDASIAVSSTYVANIERFEIGILEVKILNKLGEISLPRGTPAVMG